jgi:hypothetical protein
MTIYICISVNSYIFENRNIYVYIYRVGYHSDHVATPSQGEARVVDQNQLIRQRLSAFLERRPSWEQLIELGILGRQDVPPLAVRDGGFLSWHRDNRD